MGASVLDTPGLWTLFIWILPLCGPSLYIPPFRPPPLAFPT